MHHRGGHLVKNMTTMSGNETEDPESSISSVRIVISPIGTFLNEVLHLHSDH